MRYLGAGGAAFTADFIVLTSLTELAGFHYLVASAFGFSVGVSVNYYVSIKYVFKTRNLNNHWVEKIIFLATALVGLLLTIIFMWVFTDMQGFHYTLSKIITTGLVLVWNYSSKKVLLFR
jgi:putative flippase GtrA